MSSKDVISLIEDDPDDDIQFLGFQRVDLARSATHTRELEEDGIVYAGFHNKGRTKRVCTGRHKLEPKKAEPEVIEIFDDEDDRCPPPPQPAAATVNPSKNSQTKNTAVAHSSDDGTKQVSRSTVAVSANKRSSPPLILPGPPPKRSKPDDHKRNNSSASVAKRLLPFKCISSSSTAPMQDVIKLEDVDDVPPSEEPKREQSPSTTSFLSASIQSELHHKTTKHSDQLNSHDYMDTEEDSAYNSDDDYATLFHALNIDCSHNWKASSKILSPFSIHSRGSTSLLAGFNTAMTSSNGLSMGKWKQQSNIQQYAVGRPPPTTPKGNGPAELSGRQFVWDDLRVYHDTRDRSRRPIRRHDEFAALRHLQPAIIFPDAPGAILKMAQSAHGTVAIASAVANGEEGDEPGPYNRDGTLAVWAHDRYHILPGHAVSASSPFQELKYSTVVDVTFNPVFPERLISSRTDGTVAIWDCDSFEYGEDEPKGHIVHTACPMGILSFKIAEPLLAMAGRDGCVYLHSDKPNMPAVTDILRLAPRSGHEVADIAWGVNGSSHALFASSAPLAYGVYTGVHKVFDFEKSKTLCTFDTQAEGERIALDQAGERLAVAVRSSATAHALRMYDARRLARASVQSIDLQPFDGEVNAVAFGPGGIYIAIARSDNSAHVYDSRFLGREPMHVYKHREGNVISKDTSGVTEAVWTEGTSRGMGLVTGGVDGCIRLWDVRQAPGDGSDDNVLVQCDDDIGFFVLGDHPDTPLIVGENSGKVTIFNRYPQARYDA